MGDSPNTSAKWSKYSVGEDGTLTRNAEFCPTCTPDPGAPEIDWVTSEETAYLDKRTCEYVALIDVRLSDILAKSYDYGKILAPRYLGKLDED